MVQSTYHSLPISPGHTRATSSSSGRAAACNTVIVNATSKKTPIPSPACRNAYGCPARHQNPVCHAAPASPPPPEHRKKLTNNPRANDAIRHIHERHLHPAFRPAPLQQLLELKGRSPRGHQQRRSISPGVLAFPLIVTVQVILLLRPPVVSDPAFLLIAVPWRLIEREPDTIGSARHGLQRWNGARGGDGACVGYDQVVGGAVGGGGGGERGGEGAVVGASPLEPDCWVGHFGGDYQDIAPGGSWVESEGSSGGGREGMAGAYLRLQGSATGCDLQGSLPGWRVSHKSLSRGRHRKSLGGIAAKGRRQGTAIEGWARIYTAAIRKSLWVFFKAATMWAGADNCAVSVLGQRGTWPRQAVQVLGKDFQINHGLQLHLTLLPNGGAQVLSPTP